MMAMNLADILYKRVLDRGQVNLYGELNAESAEQFYTELGYVIDGRIDGRITVNLNSVGGIAVDAFAIYDTIMTHRRVAPVDIVVCGVAASAAAMIVLQAGDKRYITPRSRIILHEPRVWGRNDGGNTSEIRDSLTEAKAVEDAILTIMATRSGHPREEFAKLIERREVTLNAEEAIKWGLVDEIIAS